MTAAFVLRQWDFPESIIVPSGLMQLVPFIQIVTIALQFLQPVRSLDASNIKIITILLPETIELRLPPIQHRDSPVLPQFSICRQRARTAAVLAVHPAMEILNEHHSQFEAHRHDRAPQPHFPIWQ